MIPDRFEKAMPDPTGDAGPGDAESHDQEMEEFQAARLQSVEI